MALEFSMNQNEVSCNVPMCRVRDLRTNQARIRRSWVVDPGIISCTPLSRQLQTLKAQPLMVKKSVPFFLWFMHFPMKSPVLLWHHDGVLPKRSYPSSLNNSCVIISHGFCLPSTFMVTAGFRFRLLVFSIRKTTSLLFTWGARPQW